MQRKKYYYGPRVKEQEADEELLLWERWISIRKHEITRLGLAVSRPPVNLTMNRCEKVREEKEWKTVLEHAQLNEKPSIRFEMLWEQPERLKQQCYCKPEYVMQRTAAEKGKPRVIEHVSVPKYIQDTEKGLTGVSVKPSHVKVDHKLNKEFLQYKSKRENELKEKIKKIDPFKPQTAELMIIGSKPKTPPKKLPRLPTIIVKEPVEPCGENLSNVYAIKINNSIICKYIPGQNLDYLLNMKKEKWHETCTSWSYYFNTPVKRAGRCNLRIQNLGTVALRYCWKNFKKPIPFIPEDLYEQVFFFNKNEDVLSPGQTKDICFTFLSDVPGIFSEFWEINFANICFFDTMTNKIFVNLSGDSVENADKIRKKCEILKARIDKKAITNIVSDIINDAIVRATSVAPQKYPYKDQLLEMEMFLMKNPVCYYHQTEVEEMKKLYAEMGTEKTWDLAIVSWRTKMMEQDYDDRMKYYELLRKSHHELLKPWYEGESLLTQKYRAVKLLLVQMATDFDKKFDRILDLYCPDENYSKSNNVMKSRLLFNNIDPILQQNIHNLFYIHAYDVVASTVELCAGVLSSLDLNRRIDFDFCRW